MYNFNILEFKQIDKTYQDRSQCIDLIVIILNLLEQVEGNLINKTNKIINIDYRSHIIDLNLE